MKSINTLLSALFFLGAIVGITSCTEEADYTPAQKPENAQDASEKENDGENKD